MRVLAESNRALANVRQWDNAQSSKSGILKKIGCFFVDCDSLKLQLAALEDERDSLYKASAFDSTADLYARLARLQDIGNEINNIEDKLTRCC